MSTLEATVGVVLEELEISRHQTKSGQCINAKEAIDNIRNRYGL